MGGDDGGPDAAAALAEALREFTRVHGVDEVRRQISVAHEATKLAGSGAAVPLLDWLSRSACAVMAGAMPGTAAGADAGAVVGAGAGAGAGSEAAVVPGGERAAPQGGELAVGEAAAGSSGSREGAFAAPTLAASAAAANPGGVGDVTHDAAAYPGGKHTAAAAPPPLQPPPGASAYAVDAAAPGRADAAALAAGSSALPTSKPGRKRQLYTEVPMDAVEASALEEIDYEQSVVFFTGDECDPHGEGIPDAVHAAGGDVPLQSIQLEVVYKPFCNSLEESVNYPIVVGAVIAGRYRIVQQLGSGVFSHAVQCEELHSGRQVCIKVIRNNKDFLDQSLGEIKLLQYLNERDPGDEHHVLRMFDHFYYREHLFIVCELMRDNLYEMYKYVENHNWPRYFTVPRVLSVARQCLDALAFIHSCCLVHCDLKPENIVIQSQSRCVVKVIDFGSSCFIRDPHSSYVQSRSYRAPEVVLGLAYSHKIDVWSLGCILAELLTGEVLFHNRDVRTLLVAHQAVLGPMPEHMLRHGRHAHLYTVNGNLFARPDEKSSMYRYLQPVRTSLKEVLKTGDDDFVRFIGRLLELDPDVRPSAAQALQDPALHRPDVLRLPLYVPSAMPAVPPSRQHVAPAHEPGPEVPPTAVPAPAPQTQLPAPALRQPAPVKPVAASAMEPSAVAGVEDSSSGDVKSIDVKPAGGGGVAAGVAKAMGMVKTSVGTAKAKAKAGPEAVEGAAAAGSARSDAPLLNGSGGPLSTLAGAAASRANPPQIVLPEQALADGDGGKPDSPPESGPLATEEFRIELSASPEGYSRRNESLTSECLPGSSASQPLTLPGVGGGAAAAEDIGGARLWKKRGQSHSRKLHPPGARSPTASLSPQSVGSNASASAAAHAAAHALAWNRPGAGGSAQGSSSGSPAVTASEAGTSSCGPTSPRPQPVPVGAGAPAASGTGAGGPGHIATGPGGAGEAPLALAGGQRREPM